MVETIKLEVPTRMALTLLRSGLNYPLLCAAETALLSGQMHVIAEAQAAGPPKVSDGK